jgi:gluconolactonase
MKSARVTSIEVLVDGLDHPEGVVYDHSSGALYAGGERGQVYRVDLEKGTFREIGRTPGFALGMAVDGIGRLVICDSDDGAVWVMDGGRFTRLLSSVGARALQLPNYPAFGPDGTLYVTDSGGWQRDTGLTIALRPDGTTEILDDQLRRFPNGCAVTPDGKELWVLQSEGESLHRIHLERPGQPETIIRLPGTVPDGIAFTDDGGAIISCYRPDRLYHFSAEGELDVLAEDYQGTLLAAPTNVCFVGAGRSTLISANLGRWHLTRLETDLHGVIPHAPRSWAADRERA